MRALRQAQLILFQWKAVEALGVAFEPKPLTVPGFRAVGGGGAGGFVLQGWE